MTSSSEGFGRPLIEAAYNGLPTVTYDFDFGPRDAIEDGGSGFIVPIGDVDGLAERLELLSGDEALRRRFGRRAREIYDEQFATNRILERHRMMLGRHDTPSPDLIHGFATDGIEPIAIEDLVHRVHRSRRGITHHVRIGTRERLHGVQIDNGWEVRTPRIVRRLGSTEIVFQSRGNEVISYAMDEAASDRHYLANTTGAESLEVLPWLRRDSLSSPGRTPIALSAKAWHWWLPWEVQKLCAEITVVARRTHRAINWKINQVSARHLRRSH